MNRAVNSVEPQCPPQSPNLNPIENLWDVVEQQIGSVNEQLANLQKLCDAIMNQNLKGMFPTCCGINATKNLDCFESKGRPYPVLVRAYREHQTVSYVLRASRKSSLQFFFQA